MAGVEFKNLRKSYGKNEIIKGISLKINDGEFFVIVGPSGCGKSTLLRMIAGLEDITSGELLIDGKVVNRVKPKDRDIAMVFQSYALYPHLTVYENIAFGLILRKMNKDEIDRRVQNAAKILGLTDLLERYPKQLSGGQRQRVAMGRAIVRNPKVFLFDEPLSNLDAALRNQMRIELKKLHESLKTTMIYVTHDQIEAMTLADRIVVLNKGKIMQVGTPFELYNTPKNTFVAGFIGTPSMNFINGKLTKKGENIEFVCKEFSLALNKVKFTKDFSFPKDVILGIRPQDIKISKDKGSVTGSVDIIEPVGFESLVHIKVGEIALVCVVESEISRSFSTGQKIELLMPEEKIHLFERETGERI